MPTQAGGRSCRAAMNSARGTKTVTLQRKKSGLEFSVKGGTEHGIPVVVSWIKENGTAAKHLRLGDEVLAVNGESLQGLTHAQAVQQLRTAGPTVALRVRPNRTLEDIFSAEPDSTDCAHRPLNARPKPGSRSSLNEVLPEPPTHTGPLPSGWGQKVDHRTGRPYFENHFTLTTTWSDPRSLAAKSLREFKWNALPPGWQRFLDQEGDIYYVNHDTQTTHWDSPRGMRQQKQLQELGSFLQTQKEKLKAEEEELKAKRELLLEKNRRLDSLGTEEMQVVSLEAHGGESEGEDELEGCAVQEGNTSADLIDDIMLLNEEVEVMDAHLTAVRKQLQGLGEVVKNCQYEDIGERDEYQAAAELAFELVSKFRRLKELESKLHEAVKSLEELRKKHNFSDTPLQYTLQLPPLRSPEELELRGAWLHTLADKLTGKTNCEMQVEVCLLREYCKHAEQLQRRLTSLYSGAVTAHGGWEQLLEELAGCDFTPLQDQWLQAEFREKLEKFVSSDS